MNHINLSFAACGFLGIYHLGAASALCNHGRKLLKDVKAFAGASSGSLVASVLLTAPQKIEECNKFTYDFAEEIRRQSFGALTPGYDIMARLRSGVESILPANAHELAHGRLHVSITNTRTRQNCLVSSFPSREDLVKVLLASSFLPIYAGLKPVEYKGQRWVDGCFTNSLPILPVGRTVTVSPFSGRLDISPQDKGRLHFYISVTNQEVLLSVANLVRLNRVLFPPSRRTMESLYQQGFDDASSSLGYTSTMSLPINSANCQIVGFAVATTGWILGTTAMGFVEWRVWYLDNASQFSGLACVGMWRVCVFRQTNITTATSCHSYSYHDTYLPLDIRVSQHLLLMASILGLLGKASVTFALKNVSMGILENTTTYKAFVISGILHIAAGICISVAVIWNYHSVVTEEGIVFPPSFNIPFKPYAQKIGSTVIVACLAAFALFLSGCFFLSYKLPLDNQVHPEV